MSSDEQILFTSICHAKLGFELTKHNPMIEDFMRRMLFAVIVNTKYLFEICIQDM